MIRTSLGWLIGTGLAIGLNGCADSTGPVGTVVEVLDGDGQVGLAGWALERSLSVVVRGEDGVLLDGVWVEFAVTAGGGAAEPSLQTTDGDGVARSRWVLGPAGVQRLVANLPSPYETRTPAEFQANLLAASEADLVVVHGALGPIRGAMLSSENGSFGDPIGGLATDTLIPVPPRSGPGSAVALFGYANRPLIAEPDWTAGSDTVHVTLKPPVSVDILLDIQDGDFEEVVQRLGSAIDTVELIWQASGMGVEIGSVTYSDRTELQPVFVEVPCSDFVAVPPGHIQVSIVGALGYDGIAQGYACDHDLVYITGTGLADPGAKLIAHELGHTFSLLHTSRGVMGTGPAISDRFHDGETFIAHFDVGSALNLLYSSQPVAQSRPCWFEAAGCPPALFELGPR